MDFINQVPFIDELPLDARLWISRVLIAIGLFLILWLLRHFVSRLVVRPIRERVRATDSNTDDAIFDAVDGSISWVMIAVGVLVAAGVLGASGTLMTYLLRFALTLAVFGLVRMAWTLVAVLANSSDRLGKITRTDISAQIMPVVRVAGRVLVVVVGILLLASVWDISIGGVVAGIGLGGLALSLAAKEALDDVVGFIIIFTDDPFKVGEYIATPFGDGIVEHVGIRSTHIRQLNQGLTVVPNGKLVDNEITNWARLEKRWFNFMVGVTYTSTAEQIEQFVDQVKDMLKSREHVDPDSVVALFTEYDDSSLNILIRSYVDLSDWGDAKAERHAVNLEIMRIVDDLDMSIAFPSRSLYLEQIPTGFDFSNGKITMPQPPDSQRGSTSKPAGQATGAYAAEAQFNNPGENTGRDAAHDDGQHGEERDLGHPWPPSMGARTTLYCDMNRGELHLSMPSM